MSKAPKMVLEVARNVPSMKKGALHVSFSQLSTYATCPKHWHLQYVKEVGDYMPSIHTVFGTAMHETIQSWLKVLYEESVKASNEMDLDKLLHDNLVKVFTEEKAKAKTSAFTSPTELQSFYEDGRAILDYLKKHRKSYFSSKGEHLVGIEILLYQEVQPNVFFKGFVDLIIYNEETDRWKIIDLKTSTSGWNSDAKTDDKKVRQVLLYKEFFSKQYNVDIDKIDVEYFILKRKVPADPEFAVMSRRIQQFSPAAGKVKRSQAMGALNGFLREALTEDGAYNMNEPPAYPSKSNCRFCPYLKTQYCKQGVS